MSAGRDHGGALDAAIARHGGDRSGWIDLSTGINPVPYPLPALPSDAWTALPDRAAGEALVRAARSFWGVPNDADVLPLHGASAAIARIPALRPPGRVSIPEPTYNEHAAAFRAAGWEVSGDASGADARAIVHPNNPDGRLWAEEDAAAPLSIVDESFCDTMPERSLINLAARPGTLVLKSFGKFWGLAGLRLGFVIGDPALVSRLREMLGPWAVSGPALAVGAAALGDEPWAAATRARLARDSARLDTLMHGTGARSAGGTALFRLYDVGDAHALHERLARAHILTRIFPYNRAWLRLGLPAPGQWQRLEAAI